MVCPGKHCVFVGQDTVNELPKTGIEIVAVEGGVAGLRVSDGVVSIGRGPWSPRLMPWVAIMHGVAQPRLR